MTVICYVHTSGTRIPHMEALAAADVDDALRSARRMLGEHEGAYLAEVFIADRLIGSISP